MNGARTTVRWLSAPQDYREELTKAVRIGMTSTPKWFPTKYMYDKEGAALFEQITKEPHYYVYRVETEILTKYAGDIMQAVTSDELVELGSGSSAKTRLLLEAMHSTGCCRYVPLEISEAILLKATDSLTQEYDWLHIDVNIGDFDTDLPKLPRNGRRLIALLGNTVGNFKTIRERQEFLKKLSAVMITGDALLLGIDLVKDEEKIIAGYSDKNGLRRKLALRALRIMNGELGADFREENFACQRIWNRELCALQMSVVAVQEANVSIGDLQLDIEFSKGEEIILGFSTKFTKKGVTQELADAGLSVIGWYTDSFEQYAMVLATTS